MELKITSSHENKLLARVDVMADASFEKATPSNADVQAGLAKALKTDKELVVVQKITTSFGSTTARISAHQYMNKEDIVKLEPKVARKMALDKKNAKPEAAEAPAAEVKKEEPKVEEKKEEAKVEKEEAPKAEEKKAEAPKAEKKAEEPKKEHHDKKHEAKEKEEHHAKKHEEK